MSNRQLNLAFAAACGSCTEKLVLVALADAARDDGHCWHSVGSMMKRCALSRQGFLNQVEILEKRGWLWVDRTPGKPNHYHLSIPEDATSRRRESRSKFGRAAGATPSDHPVDGSEASSGLSDRLPPVYPVDTHRSMGWTAPVYPIDPNHKEPSVEPKGNPHAPEEEAAASVEEFVKVWNSLGKPFSTIRQMTGSRKKALKARGRDAFWREHWRDGIQQIGKSEFCRGANGRGWIADADFLLRADSLAKIIEGKYDNRGPAANSRASAGSRGRETLPAELANSF